MLPTEINQNIRYRIYFWAAATTLLMAVTALITGHVQSALLAFIFSGLLIISSLHLKKTMPSNLSSEEEDESARTFEPKTLLTHTIMLLLAGITLFSMSGQPQQAEPWIYVFPLLVYFLYPLKLAHYITIVYTALLLVLLSVTYHSPVKVELFLNYLLCLLLTLIFVYLRETRNRQIKPLRRTDNLTSASTKEYLQDDLEKEILRSEREGTGLTVLALAVDPSTLPNMQETDKDVLLSRLGHMLHALLRPFDGYYRLEQDEFIISLPHTRTRDALKTAEKIRLQAKETLGKNERNITVSIGISGLNVGDNAESLCVKSLNALKEAQMRGNNCSRSFVDKQNDIPGNSHD